MSENQFWIKLHVILGAVIVAVTIMVVGCNIDSNHKFVEGAYCQTAVVGSSNLAWTKCPK